MADYGFKISLPGYDVKTATPEQCAVHSSYPAPKAKSDPALKHTGQIHVTFATNKSSGSTYTLYSFAHGYSYTPTVMAHMVYSSSVIGTINTMLPFVPVLSPNFSVSLSADSTNVYLKFSYNSGFESDMRNVTMDISYYIFAEAGA